jgi:hypothetical protein
MSRTEPLATGGDPSELPTAGRTHRTRANIGFRELDIIAATYAAHYTPHLAACGGADARP